MQTFLWKSVCCFGCFDLNTLTGKLPWSCDPLHAHSPHFGLADGKSSSSSLSLHQLSARAGVSSHCNLALMDRMLTFHEIRDTMCSGDSKIQIGLFWRATQSCFCSWISWQITCQNRFCLFSSWVLVQCAKDMNLQGAQSVPFQSNSGEGDFSMWHKISTGQYFKLNLICSRGKSSWLCWRYAGVSIIMCVGIHKYTF